MIWKRKGKAKDYIYIKKQDKIIAIISKDNFACAFINDYNKRLKLKIRLVTHDFIDVGVDSYDEAVEILEDIKRQTHEE